jgi:hypothetical protein
MQHRFFFKSFGFEPFEKCSALSRSKRRTKNGHPPRHEVQFIYDQVDAITPSSQVGWHPLLLQLCAVLFLEEF